MNWGREERERDSLCIKLKDEGSKENKIVDQNRGTIEKCNESKREKPSKVDTRMPWFPDAAS